MKSFIYLAALSVSCKLFAGTIGGGSNPPALQHADEQLAISSEQFQILALDALQKPDVAAMLNGKAAKPLMIDIQSKILRFEAVETKQIIDVSVEAPL